MPPRMQCLYSYERKRFKLAVYANRIVVRHGVRLSMRRVIYRLDELAAVRCQEPGQLLLILATGRIDIYHVGGAAREVEEVVRALGHPSGEGRKGLDE